MPLALPIPRPARRAQDSSPVRDTEVRRFAQMPANRNNPGVHHIARQSRDRKGASADSLAGMRSLTVAARMGASRPSTLMSRTHRCPVRQHWEKDGPASAPGRGGRTLAAVLLTPRSGAGKRRPPATHGCAPWATVFRPSGSAGGGIGGADPLVRAGPPGPALACQNQFPGAGVWPVREPAADGGVRPTFNADHQ